MNALQSAIRTSGLDQTLPYKLVVHTNPDTDAILCHWVASRFIAGKEKVEHEFCFVPAGEKLPENERAGFRVLEMDTGLGDLDQHGKRLTGTSSFELVLKKFGLENDPGLKPFLELANATDNVKEVSLTSIHYLLKARRFSLKDPTTREMDWGNYLACAFEDLDTLYQHYRAREDARRDYEQKGTKLTLANGMKIVFLLRMPNAREAAFEAGAQVVMWTAIKNHGFYVGIQVNRNAQVKLTQLMAAIRQAEGTRRGIRVKQNALVAIGQAPEIPGWYLHDSERFIACGTNSHKLEPGEFTKLTPTQLMTIVERELTKLKAA